MDTDIGKWQGKSLKMLRLTKAWKIVQSAPSRFRFPEGESFPDVRPHHEHPGADHPKASQAAGHCGGSLSRGPDQAGDLTFSGHAARSLSTPELRHRFIDCAARGRRQRKFDQVKSRPPFDFLPKDKKKE